ncbi:MAG TPA: hypothetical protein VGX37_08925 [Allosphingosinicella sp.]|jgi:hypothetical protein|nr:hypothetical protein [Allosphingosinicella sp.]
MKKSVLALAALSACSGAATTAQKQEPTAVAAPRPAAVPAAPGQANAAAAAARGVEDPHAFVQSTYEAYRRGGTESVPEWPAFAYSDRLKALFDAYDAWTAQHDDLVGSLDFDWWINAQDWELGPVAVTEEAQGPDRRTERARFTNGGRPEEIRFLFTRSGNRWFLDDVVEGTGSGDGGWTLSQLLRERPE